MDGVRNYILSVTATAMFLGIVKGILGENGTMGTVFRLICGGVMVFAVVSPWKNLNFEELELPLEQYLQEGEACRQAGEESASAAIAELIKEQTAAYILDKAAEVKADLQVEVTVSTDTVPIPVEVRLTGNVSPYGKARLESLLEEDLGIAKEHQIWIGGT